VKRFANQIHSYDAYHQNQKNQFTHFIGVPLIVFALLLLGGHFFYTINTSFLSFLSPIFSNLKLSVSISDLAVVGLVFYYIFLRSPSFYLIPTMFVLIGFLLVSQYYSHHLSNLTLYALSAGLFLIGWIFQFLGHYFEGNKPALFDNLSHIFIAPIYLVSKLIAKIGFKIHLI
jgi:uncharacterized membrane protein YGL010W